MQNPKHGNLASKSQAWIELMDFSVSLNVHKINSASPGGVLRTQYGNIVTRIT